MFRPTEEQQIAVTKFCTGRPLKIAAFAGSGKTSTLQLLAKSNASRGIYLAFNKAIAAEARERFPRHVDCRTTHAIAFRAVMPNYDSTAKLTTSLRARQLAQVMAFKDIVLPGPFRLEQVQQAHLVLGTVRRFCQSDDAAIGRDHVPRYGRLLGLPDELLAQIQGWAVGQAAVLWARMVDRRDDVPLGHDGYLKLWALSRPSLPAAYILLDEAQDTNAVVLGVLKHQDAQIVYVGDRHQQIYEWRGALNAMEQVVGCEEAALTQSFRFGDAIAAAASQVLATLGERQRIRGNPAIASTIGASGPSAAVLARTNGTVILEVLEAAAAGQTPCVVGGTQEIRRLLSDVYELKAGKSAASPEFFGFDNWPDVVAFAETEEGEDLRTFVQLVEQHGENKLWAAVKSAQDDEEGADVILSTAHKAKGREWDAVRLAPDFVSSRLGPDPGAASEVRLFYVAMTRAKRSLIVDPEVLATFATTAWKAKRSRPAADAPTYRPMPRSGAQTPPSPPPARPTHIREVTPPAIRSQHPGAAEAAPSTPQPPPSLREAPPPRAAWGGTPPKLVPVRPTARQATARDGGNHRANTADVAASKRDTLWSRVARLFGAS